MELRTHDADDTRAVGRALAAVLRAADVVALSGDLGAGKTTFVQGIAAGLGVEEHVTSPTFTLVREYRGRLDVAHVDVYRLEREQDVVDLGLEEIGDGDAVLLVEWGDAVGSLLPADRLHVVITAEDRDDGTRRLILSASGGSWADRWASLGSAVERWSVRG